MSQQQKARPISAQKMRHGKRAAGRSAATRRDSLAQSNAIAAEFSATRLQMADRSAVSAAARRIDEDLVPKPEAELVYPTMGSSHFRRNAIVLLGLIATALVLLMMPVWCRG